jgi:hypothetical protein
MTIHHHKRDLSLEGYQRMPGPGYTAHFHASTSVLMLHVDDLRDIHYIAQPQVAVNNTLIRFKSGEMFSTPNSFEEVQTLVRAAEPFLIVPVPAHESPDLKVSTVGIIDRAPQRALIDVGSAMGIDMVLSMNPAPEQSILTQDNLPNCIASPGAIRSTMALTPETLGRLKQRILQPSGGTAAPTGQPEQAQA